MWMLKIWRWIPGPRIVTETEKIRTSYTSVSDESEETCFPKTQQKQSINEWFVRNRYIKYFSVFIHRFIHQFIFFHDFYCRNRWTTCDLEADEDGKGLSNDDITELSQPRTTSRRAGVTIRRAGVTIIGLRIPGKFRNITWWGFQRHCQQGPVGSVGFPCYSAIVHRIRW